MKYLKVLPTLVVLLGAAGMCVKYDAGVYSLDYARESHLNWCRQPGEMTYWRTPMPPEMKHRVRMYVAASLRDGCFDGRNWSPEEINKALPL